jgi:hypothetical protein
MKSDGTIFSKSFHGRKGGRALVRRGIEAQRRWARSCQPQRLEASPGG